MIRIAIAVLLSLLLAGTTRAGPCSILLVDELPCEIEEGDRAPYRGTLMTDSTARDLHGKVLDLWELQIDMESLRLASKVRDETNAKRITDLRIDLENAPRPLLEQPAFWIVSGVALIGGFVTGWVLASE